MQLHAHTRDMTQHLTLVDLASIDGPPLAAIHGPDEPVESLTGSGATLTGARNVKRVGHSPDVIGSQSTSGTPTGWGDGPIDATALPRTDTVVRRTSKGRTTYRASKYVPQHRRTVGRSNPQRGSRRRRTSHSAPTESRRPRMPSAGGPGRPFVSRHGPGWPRRECGWSHRVEW
jgi:hypothetical protein